MAQADSPSSCLHASEQRVRTGRDGQTNGQTRAGLAAKGRADRFMGFTESIESCALYGRSKSRQALAKIRRGHSSFRAEEPSNRNSHFDGPAETRQVSKGAVYNGCERGLTPEPQRGQDAVEAVVSSKTVSAASLDAAMIEPTPGGTPQGLRKEAKKTLRAMRARAG